MKSQVRESSERSDDTLTNTNSPISNSMKNQIYNTLKKDIIREEIDFESQNSKSLLINIRLT
jgi:hypothetical protein